MKKYILFQPFPGAKSVRVYLNKKTYINPRTGKRLKTKNLINQHKKYIQSKQYNNKLLRRIEKEGARPQFRDTFGKIKFGNEYLKKFSKIKTSRARFISHTAKKLERNAYLALQNELEIRRDIDINESYLSDSTVKRDGIFVRPAKEILAAIREYKNPRFKNLYQKQAARIIRSTNKTFNLFKNIGKRKR